MKCSWRYYDVNIENQLKSISTEWMPHQILIWKFELLSDDNKQSPSDKSKSEKPIHKYMTRLLLTRNGTIKPEVTHRFVLIPDIITPNFVPYVSLNMDINETR